MFQYFSCKIKLRYSLTEQLQRINSKLIDYCFKTLIYFKKQKFKFSVERLELPSISYILSCMFKQDLSHCKEMLQNLFKTKSNYKVVWFLARELVTDSLTGTKAGYDNVLDYKNRLKLFFILKHSTPLLKV